MSAAIQYVASSGMSSADAQLVGEALAQIRRKQGDIETKRQKQALIDLARPAKSRFHGLFEWDPEKQQQSYLLHRAGELIRWTMCFTVERPQAPMRALVSVSMRGKSAGHNSYIPIQSVLSDKEWMSEWLAKAKRDAALWVKNYEDLRDLAQLRGVFEAIDALK
jgi:hypothetical protein